MIRIDLKLWTKLLWMVACIIGLPAVCFAGTSVTLVRDGKPVSTIIVAKDAVRSAQFAAYELQYHVEKITGATLPIVNDDVDVAGTKILVGDTRATAAMGLRNADFQPQEYLIGFRRDALVLIGRDSDDRRAVDYANGRTFPYAFEDQGTCYATYDFLERFCGVRWYLPTELGLVCPSRKTLTLTGKDIRRSPAIKYRWMTPVPGCADLCGDTVAPPEQPPLLSDRDNELWNRRYRIGGEPYEANHAFYGYYDRFLKQHPDWFATGYDGLPPQMCYTNPEFIAQVVQDARDYFDGKGLQPKAIAKGDYFSLVPMDGGGWCKCANCQELLKGGDSNYFYAFVNKVAVEIKKSHPNKWLSTLAYSTYYAVPTNVRLDSNVTIMTCLDIRNAVHNPPYQSLVLKKLADWVAESKDRPKYLWLYYCWPSLQASSLNFNCFPGFFAHQLVRDMQVFNKSGVRGIFFEPSYLPYGLKSFIFDQLEWYITWRMADDPRLDGNKLIDEFFVSYYGAASKPMKSAYEKIESIYCDPKSYPGGDTSLQTEVIAWKYLGTEARMQEIGVMVKRAKQSARTDIEKQRIDLFDRGILQYMETGRKAWLEHERLKETTMQEISVPVIAGVAGDATRVDWSKATAVSDWYTTMGQSTPRKLDARICHDTEYLYLRLEEQIDTKTIVLTDDNVWMDDDWELFFAGARAQPYNQMGINARGFHIDIATGESAERWDSGARVASDISSGDKWTIHIAIPLRNLVNGGASAGDTIYANIFRGAARAQVQNSGVWVPTFGKYAEPGRFGKMVLEK